MTKSVKKSFSVLLVQLPLLNANLELREKFIPLALGYLYASAKLANTQAVIETLTFEESQLSDNNLLKLILNKEPNVVGFSCYVWNTSRTLYLVERIKQHMPDIKIILGGPEISKDNPLIFSGVADILVFGQGEQTLIELIDCIYQGKTCDDITGIAVNRNDAFQFTDDRLIRGDLDYIATPYVPDIIDNFSGINYALIETRRGCPFNCAYCYYGKGIKNLTYFSLQRVLNDFKFVKQQGIESVYIIDPCFNTNKYFEQIVSGITEINSDPKVEIQIEARAELINKKQVELMKNANITRVEVGLQSRNEETLKNIKRATDFNKFEQGVKLLLENGINVIIGAIHGLPGDDLNTIKRTVDYITANFPSADNHFYPLCVLPSTKIRNETEHWGLKFQDNPPYLVIGNKNISQKELKEAFRYSEKAITDKFEALPLFAIYSGVISTNLMKVKDKEINNIQLISRVFLEETIHTNELIDSIIESKIKPRLANSLVLFFKTEKRNYKPYIERLNKLLIQIYQHNPNIILNIIIEFSDFMNADLTRLFEGIKRERGYLDYTNLYRLSKFISNKDKDTVNASLRVFKIDKGEQFMNSFLKPISQIYFDDESLHENFTFIEKKMGLLIETPDSIPNRNFFEYLKKKVSNEKSVRFINLIAQKVWDEIINKGVTNLPLGEHTLVSSEEGLQTAYFDKNEIMLDAGEWILVNKLLKQFLVTNFLLFLTNPPSTLF